MILPGCQSASGRESRMCNRWNSGAEQRCAVKRGPRWEDSAIALDVAASILGAVTAVLPENFPFVFFSTLSLIQ
jgi:hypothetical protein